MDSHLSGARARRRQASGQEAHARVAAAARGPIYAPGREAWMPPHPGLPQGKPGPHNPPACSREGDGHPVPPLLRHAAAATRAPRRAAPPPPPAHLAQVALAGLGQRLQRVGRDVQVVPRGADDDVLVVAQQLPRRRGGQQLAVAVRLGGCGAEGGGGGGGRAVSDGSGEAQVWAAHPGGGASLEPAADVQAGTPRCGPSPSPLTGLVVVARGRLAPSVEGGLVAAGPAGHGVAGGGVGHCQISDAVAVGVGHREGHLRRGGAGTGAA
jgi:hypothetical protein